MAMKRLVMMTLVLLPFLASAQAPKPDWYEADSRKFLYPDADYFVGFSSGFARQGETVEAATARVKTDAQGDAAQRIQVHVQSSTLDEVKSMQSQTARGFDEEIQRLFAKQTTTSATMDIPNLQSMTWSDPATREVAVMVYTRRRDFVRFYDRQIESLLGKMETGLETALEQERQGAQIKGRATAEQTLLICPQVEYAQLMVALADVNATMEDLQMPRYGEVVKQLTATVVRLRHATSFYIDCRATINGNSYSLLDKEVRGLLAERGCHFTDERESADWVVDISADIINTEHREGMAYFAYVDGDLSVHNGKTGKRVFEDRLSTLEKEHHDGIKGGDFKPEKAARIAYHEAARIIAETILKLVQE